MSVAITKELAGFLSGFTADRVPREAAEVACKGFADSIASMVAGRRETCVTATETALASLAARPANTDPHLYLSDRRAPALVAACINGTAAHALDYDDVALRGHPSSVLMTTALIEGESLDLPGAQVVAAYVAGYEIWAELVRREPGQLRTKGWHPTGMYGSIAAAAVAIVARRLPASIAQHALGIAASQAAGLSANFGSMTKPFHAGRAAQSGILAVALALAGMTASHDALEHPQGFLHAFSPEGRVDRETPTNGLGRDWQIVKQGLSVKRYPICYSAHRAVDAMLGLLAKHRIDAAEIERIEVSLGQAQANMLRHHAPTAVLEAKFSAEFAMAAAIVAGRLGLRELTEDFVTRHDIQSLLKRVAIAANEDYDPDLSDYSRFDQVTVHLKNGDRLISDQIRRPIGHASQPLGWDELWPKFDDCLAGDFSSSRRERLFESLRNLPAVASIRSLF